LVLLPERRLLPGDTNSFKTIRPPQGGFLFGLIDPLKRRRNLYRIYCDLRNKSVNLMPKTVNLRYNLGGKTSAERGAD
jgi:hypothetical protein